MPALLNAGADPCKQPAHILRKADPLRTMRASRKSPAGLQMRASLGGAHAALPDTAAAVERDLIQAVTLHLLLETLWLRSMQRVRTKAATCK